MRVILEAQHAVGHLQPRGVGHYAIQMIQTLLRRNTFEYGLTFFDCNGEAGNRERAVKHFGSFHVPFYECNELDYRVASRDDARYGIKTYNEWTGAEGAVYHFMSPVCIPVSLNGKMIVTVHDLSWCSSPGILSEHETDLFKIGRQRIERTSPIIITDSESSRNEILKYIDGVRPEQVKRVYLSYDEKNMFPEKTAAVDKAAGRYLFYVGAFERKKNIARLIKAFNIVAEKDRELKLVIAGKPTWDDTTEIYDAVSSSPCWDRIVMPGYISVEQKRQLYSNALCFVFPSICEGFGIPVLEAMACGCPVITADNTSLPEVGGDAAVYVDACSIEQLAWEIERVTASEGLRKEMAAKGLVQVKRFSWDKTAGQVENVYRDAANIL